MEPIVLADLTVGGLALIEGVQYLVVNPAQGWVVTLDPEPSIKNLRPSAPVTHFGECNYGTHITWKRFGDPSTPPNSPDRSEV